MQGGEHRARPAAVAPSGPGELTRKPAASLKGRNPRERVEAPSGLEPLKECVRPCCFVQTSRAITSCPSPRRPGASNLEPIASLVRDQDTKMLSLVLDHRDGGLNVAGVETVNVHAS